MWIGQAEWNGLNAQLNYIVDWLKYLNRRLSKMTLDLTKIAAAVQAELAEDDVVLAHMADLSTQVSSLSAQVTEVSAQLAAAVAANDPAATAAAQAQLDGLAESLAAESKKFADALPPADTAAPSA